MTPDPRTPPALLQAISVSKTYGRTRVLTDATLTVEPGQIYALLGGNGSGKSTLIKALAGVVAFDPGGQIEAGGQIVPASRWSPHHARQAHLRFVHQDLGLFPDLSVIDNLALGSGYVRTRWGRVRWAAAHDHAEILLRRYGIDARPTARVAELSLAQGAMLAIARALQDVGDGEQAVVVLDEPTGALPADEADSLHQSLRGLVSLGHSVLLVTHDIDEALTKCDRVTVLRDGVRIHSGPTRELDRSRLIKLIVGRPAEDLPRRHTQDRAEAAPVLEIARLGDSTLDVANIVVHAGEVVGLTGLLGSGAEDVLRAIFGLTPFPWLDMRIGGHPYAPTNPRTAMRHGIAYLPSDRLRDGAFCGLSVLENITAASIRHAAPHGRIRHRVERRESQHLVTAYGVSPADPRRRIESLSGGNQQKVLLARWARRTPRLLLLDDPTRGVDVGARAEIWSLLTQATRTADLAILVTSSDPEELAANCDRILVLGRGRIQEELSGTDMNAARITSATYAAAATEEMKV